MYEIPTKIEGKQYSLYKLEEALKPIGYSIGGGWDYDQGYFDFKMANDEGYQFLRVPFTPVDGELDTRGVVVQLGKPFILNHVYQEAVDDEAGVGVAAASFDQFAEPKDRDGDIPKKYIDFGKELVRELEQILS
ncbi:YugN-like family protein [Heyndrickxia oleronia]|uniref:YugN-like family protein n=1 Tax=Heyndrickxia TaxID=2837504 RepID=UPI00203C2BAA|nr:YugN-like family protein [Heyndrickxia oleronia]MCM3457381.1 YugN-like family protein [Heyndrickxia oleronia]